MTFIREAGKKEDENSPILPHCALSDVLTPLWDGDSLFAYIMMDDLVYHTKHVRENLGGYESKDEWPLLL